MLPAQGQDNSTYASKGIASQRDNFRVSMRREDRLNEITKRRRLDNIATPNTVGVISAEEIMGCSSKVERTWGH